MQLLKQQENRLSMKTIVNGVGIFFFLLVWGLCATVRRILSWNGGGRRRHGVV